MEKNNDALTKLVEGQLFKGEELKYQMGNVKLQTEFHGEIAGRLFITNYQCIFVEDEIPHHFTSVHLHSIHRVKKTSKSKAPDGTGGVDIVCKDFRRVSLRVPNTPRGSRKAVVEELSKYAFPPLSKLFAYSFEENLGETNGWKLYDAEQEYARLGLDRDNWKLTTINDGHKFADTYPEKVAIPASVSDDKMKEAAKFRTHCRMIATVWKHPKNNATISRSSQPRRGLTGRRSQPDENLLDVIAKLNTNTDTMYILDSRPKINATANALTGGGYESTKSYLNTIREFAKIENIHDMRYSAKKLFRVCEKFTTDLVKNQPKTTAETANTNETTTNDENNANGQTGGATNWWSELQATKWLDHIRAILAAANRITELLDKEQASVLVHCSDGWDRTAQMTALGELMLDPYYRTISGFAQLVEKEWSSFGHRFAIRGGHDVNMGNFKDKERSPVFLQFIDCVWQLTEQYPVDFEFNSHFLVTIMDHFFDSMFGTFLGNCDLERKKLKVPEKTVSLWTLVLNQPDIFANNKYSPENHVLYANVSKAKIRLWESFYLRWRVLDLHGVVLSLEDNLKSYNLGTNKYWSEKYRTTIGDEVPMIILGDESHPDGQDDEMIRVESSANLKKSLSAKRVAPNGSQQDERPRIATTMGDDSDDGTRSADNTESESESSDSSDRPKKKKNAISGASSPAQSPTGRGGKNRSQSTMDPPGNRPTAAPLRTSDAGISPREKTTNNNNTNSITDDTKQDVPSIVVEPESKTDN